jgi:hypothetical protein
MFSHCIRTLILFLIHYESCPCILYRCALCYKLPHSQSPCQHQGFMGPPYHHIFTPVCHLVHTHTHTHYLSNATLQTQSFLAASQSYSFLFFTLLSPCIMNQIKIKRPTNTPFNHFNVVSLYHPTRVLDVFQSPHTLRNVQIAQTAPHHNPTQRKNTQST